MPVVTKFPTTNQAAGAPFNGSWTNPNSAHTDNSTSATTTTSTQVASAAPGKNQEFASVWSVPFSTSDIPNGATINSVTVEVEWRMSTTSSVGEMRSTAFADSAQTTAVSASPGVVSATPEPTNLTVQSYSATPSLAQLRDLWVRVQALRGNSNTAVTAYLDYVKVTVDYTDPAPSFTGSGGVSFGFSEAGSGTVGLPASTGTGAVAFGFALSGTGGFQPAPVTGSGSVTFGFGLSGSGTVTAPTFTGTGDVAFGFASSGSGSASVPQYAGSGDVTFAFGVEGSGSAEVPTFSGDGGVAFSFSSDGSGSVSVPEGSGAGGVTFGFALEATGTATAPSVSGTGGTTFGFATAGSGAFFSEGGQTYPYRCPSGHIHHGPNGPWETHGVLHYGHEPNH